LIPDAQGRLVSQQLRLALNYWQGRYKDIDAVWLRWATLEGELLPTPEEAAEQEYLRAEREKQRAERLAAQLRSLGVEPDQ